MATADGAAGAGGPVDLWDEVVGQDDAVAQLRAAARDPVHAFLLVGPDGSGTREAATAFAAELLAAGLDEAAAARARHLASAGAHPSLIVVEPEGATFLVADAERIVAAASMKPPEGDRQVIVLSRIEPFNPAAFPMLLKTIEEPAPGTFVVVLAERVPPELVTIASRCMRIDLQAVASDVLERRLVAEGVDPGIASVVAPTAGGSLRRARLLAADPSVGERRRAWFEAPERLDGTGATAMALADELLAGIDAVLEPLEERQREEMAVFLEPYESREQQPTKSALGAVEGRHKREQRRIVGDELLAGLAAIVERYRTELAAGGSTDDFLVVAQRVQEFCDALAFNPNTGLQLRALLVGLPRLAGG